MESKSKIETCIDYESDDKVSFKEYCNKHCNVLHQKHADEITKDGHMSTYLPMDNTGRVQGRCCCGVKSKDHVRSISYMGVCEEGNYCRRPIKPNPDTLNLLNQDDVMAYGMELMKRGLCGCLNLYTPRQLQHEEYLQTLPNYNSLLEKATVKLLQQKPTPSYLNSEMVIDEVRRQHNNSSHEIKKENGEQDHNVVDLLQGNNNTSHSGTNKLLTLNLERFTQQQQDQHKQKQPEYVFWINAVVAALIVLLLINKLATFLFE